MDFSDMHVCCVDYSSHWGDLDSDKSDWALIQDIACFSHKEACEFIVWVTPVDVREEYVELGLSSVFIALCEQAVSEGYSYICFYS